MEEKCKIITLAIYGLNSLSTNEVCNLFCMFSISVCFIRGFLTNVAKYDVQFRTQNTKIESNVFPESFRQDICNNYSIT